MQNPSFQDGYPAEKQDPSSPPPPYYPSAPGPPNMGPYYPPASGPPDMGPYYPPAPGPPAPGPYYQPYYPSAPMPPPQQPLMCQQSTNVVVVNPQSVTIRQRHSDYLCWSICNLLCCFWPLGLAAIIFSCKTRSDDDYNNAEAAACSSKTALALNITSLVAGIVMYIIIVVVYTQRAY